MQAEDIRLCMKSNHAKIIFAASKVIHVQLSGQDTLFHKTRAREDLAEQVNTRAAPCEITVSGASPNDVRTDYRRARNSGLPEQYAALVYRRRGALIHRRSRRSDALLPGQTSSADAHGSRASGAKKSCAGYSSESRFSSWVVNPFMTVLGCPFLKRLS
jgi:hypothetical protein